MSIALRNTVRNAKELIRWAARAEAGQSVTYHIGNLGLDRVEAPTLHLLAETVMVFAEHQYISTSQVIMRLPMESATWYSATRTGRGRPPRSIMFDLCNAHHYRALEAVRERDASRSISRAIRDHMGCPEQTAQQFVATLPAKNWIERAEPKGWQLSRDGLRMLA